MKSLFRPLALVITGILAATGAFAQHDHGSPAAAAASEKVTAGCPVSGEKLGAMGEPVSYVYKEAGKPDRVIQFCCKDCIKDFEKEPAKYLAKLDAKAGVAALAGKMAGDKAGACACCAEAQGCELLTSYVPISEALAADDLAKAKTCAAALAKEADSNGMKPVAQHALAVSKADSIAAARTAFKALSNDLTPMAVGTKGYVVMNCPMANADWVQTDAKVRNPYYGKMMLTCGTPKTAQQ